jgi:hypothetical protein
VDTWCWWWRDNILLFSPYLHRTNTNIGWQINITNDQKRQLDASLAGANPDVFNKIQHSIFNLLETDCFPRFLDSDLYKEYEQGSHGSHINNPPPSLASWLC